MRLLTILSFFLFVLFSAWAREPLPGVRYEALSGIQNNKDEKIDPSSKRVKKSSFQEKNPSAFLAENLDYLPAGAQVLDVAMGDGRNAVFLARKNFKVTALEKKEEDFKKAKMFAKEFGVRVDFIFDETRQHQFPHQSFDAIICFYQVDKKLIDKMKNWLRPNGILILEGHTEQELRIASGERTLRAGELLEIFKGYRILKYEEPLHKKEFTASIIVKKD